VSDESEARVARVIQTARNRLAVAAMSDEVLTEITRSGRRSRDVAAAFPWQEFRDELRAAEPAFRAEMLTAGADAGRGVLATSMAAFRFDRTDPRATAAARAFAGMFVRHVDRSTRNAVRLIITDAFVSEVTVDRTARRIQQTVGLTPRQAQAVANTDQRVRERLLAQGRPERFARDRARTLAGQQATRLHRVRANTIARTEIGRAQGIGRYLGWEQAEGQGLMDLETYGKRWVSLSDACPICSDNTSESPIPARDTFTSSGTLMNPGHPSCRCSVVAVPSGYGGWSGAPRNSGPPSIDQLVAYSGG